MAVYQRYSREPPATRSQWAVTVAASVLAWLVTGRNPLELPSFEHIERRQSGPKFTTNALDARQEFSTLVGGAAAFCK
jgi:hypothetical protein